MEKFRQTKPVYGNGFCALVGIVLLPVLVFGTPRIVAEDPHFDFGEQSNQQTIDHTFLIRNEGDSDLSILQIRSSCGCTVGNVTAREIAPGETSEITASYNLRGRRGRQLSVLTIESNDPHQRQLRLTLGGYAVQEMTVRPATVVFGQVTEGHRSLRHVELVGLPERPFDLSSATVSGEGFALVAQEEVAAHHYRLSVEAIPGPGSGHRQGLLQLQTTHPHVPAVQVPLSAEWAGALSVAPNAITLVAGNERPVTRYIVVRPGSVREFEVTDVIPPLESIQVNLLRLPNQSYRIQLLNVIASDELIGKSVRIRTDVEGLDDLEVPFELIDPSS